MIIMAMALLSSAALFAQPRDGGKPAFRGGFAAELPYPVVYEGPDVVFRKIADGLYVGSGHVMATESLYILEGTERAMLIDTGTEIPDLDKIVAGITSLPLTVVITHAHPDHSGAAKYFDEVWVNPADEKDLGGYLGDDYKGTVRIFGNGHRWNLGGRIIEALYTPAHTPGSTTFMDVTNHYGFSGDSFGNGNLLLMGTFTTLMKTCQKTLDYMYANEIYWLYNGHFNGSNTESPKRLWDLISISEDLLSGKVQGDKVPAGLGGLDHVYTREGVRVNYGGHSFK